LSLKLSATRVYEPQIRANHSTSQGSGGGAESSEVGGNSSGGLDVGALAGVSYERGTPGRVPLKTCGIGVNFKRTSAGNYQVPPYLPTFFFFFFFFTLVTGSRRSLSLKLSDTRNYDCKRTSAGNYQVPPSLRTFELLTCIASRPACAVFLSSTVSRAPRHCWEGATVSLPDIEQWLQRHPEAGPSWPSWPRVSQPPCSALSRARACVARSEWE